MASMTGKKHPLTCSCFLPSRLMAHDLCDTANRYFLIIPTNIVKITDLTNDFQKKKRKSKKGQRRNKSIKWLEPGLLEKRTDMNHSVFFIIIIKGLI